MKTRLAAVLAVLAFLAALGTAAATFGQSPDGPVLQQDITYRVADGVELKLDLACPSAGKGPFPALIFLPGNCWGECGGLGSRTAHNTLIVLAARQGYVGATVDHRPSSVAPFPAQLYDVKAAVRWLRANARQYQIDPGRIGVAGRSSGGHLALLLGFTSPSDGLEGDGADTQGPSAVQAVVSAGGPTDLAGCRQSLGGWVDKLLGGSPDQVPDNYRRASVLTYVTRGGPPVLLIHGDQDEFVPFTQATLLDAKFQDAGVVHTLILKKGGRHSDYLWDPVVLAFFDKCFKGR